MTAWLALLTAIATAATRIADLFRKKQEQAAVEMPLPKRPAFVDRLTRPKPSPSAGSANGSSAAK